MRLTMYTAMNTPQKWKIICVPSGHLFFPTWVQENDFPDFLHYNLVFYKISYKCLWGLASFILHEIFEFRQSLLHGCAWWHTP